MSKLKIAVLFGGKSEEHEVSLASARSIINAFHKKKYEIIPIGITKQGRWISRPDILKLLELKSKQIKKFQPALLNGPDKNGLIVIKDNQAGIIKYKNEKFDMKMIFNQNNLPAAKYIWFNKKDWQSRPSRIIKKIERNLKYPCFVKPANLGSSVGRQSFYQRS